MGQCIEFQKTGQTLFVGASIGRPFFVWCCRGDHRSPENRIHFVGNGTPSPSCHPSGGSAVSSPQGKPIVSVADTKKYAIRRGDHRSPFFVWCCRDDHRSPENRIHFVGDSASASFLPPLRHFVPPLLKERLLRRPLRGAVVKRLRGGEQQFNIKKAVIH